MPFTTSKEYLKKHELDLQIVVEARDLEEIRRDFRVMRRVHRILIDNFQLYRHPKSH